MSKKNSKKSSIDSDLLPLIAGAGKDLDTYVNGRKWELEQAWQNAKDAGQDPNAAKHAAWAKIWDDGYKLGKR